MHLEMNFSKIRNFLTSRQFLFAVFIVVFISIVDRFIINIPNGLISLIVLFHIFYQYFYGSERLTSEEHAKIDRELARSLDERATDAFGKPMSDRRNSL